MTVSIEPLHCGTLTAPRGMFVEDGGDEPTELPVPAWLIRHPNGLVLFDCGMHRDLTQPGELFDMVSLFFELGIDAEAMVAAQLESRDVDPADIDIVVASHLHFDHVGGLAQIPNARLIVNATEWAAGFDPDLAAVNSFRTDDFDLGHDVVTVEGEHDIFGDGLVRCIPTPGHTPGHQSLAVRLADREIVLCADCAYFAETLDGGALPPIGHDHEQHAKSIEALQAMARSGSTLIPGHDKTNFDALPDRIV